MPNSYSIKKVQPCCGSLSKVWALLLKSFYFRNAILMRFYPVEATSKKHVMFVYYNLLEVIASFNTPERHINEH